MTTELSLEQAKNGIIRPKQSHKEAAAVLSPTLLCCRACKQPSPPLSPCPGGRGASSLAAVAATRRQMALLIFFILPLGGGTAGGEAQPPSPLGSRTETILQEDRRCDSLISLPRLWSLQTSSPPGKSNWEMVNKPSYLNPSCLRQEQELTRFGEHILVLSKRGARSLSKDTHTVQHKQSLSDFLYKTRLSLSGIPRGASQLLSGPMLSVQHDVAPRHYAPQAPPGGRTLPGHPWCYQRSHGISEPIRMHPLS